MPRSFEHDTVIHCCSTDTLLGFNGRNYPTCVEQADRHHADLLRLRECGFHEGPLLFTPHLVTPMGRSGSPRRTSTVS